MTASIEQAARKLRSARKAQQEAMEQAAAAAIEARDAGISEVSIAKTLGVNRMTVRRWLGKL